MDIFIWVILSIIMLNIVLNYFSKNLDKTNNTMDEDLTTFIIDKSSNQQELDTHYPNKITLNRIKTEGNECWVPKGTPVTISDITINNGMIYFGEKLHTQNTLYVRQDNCLINPKLKVVINNIEHDSENIKYDSETLPYWSSYSAISPQARYQYLIWLSKGAKDPNVDIGYVFLYFYGLERRLFLEQSKKDEENIIDEIKRLITIYGNNNSVSCYLTNALFLGEIIAHKKPSFLEIKINGYKREIPIYIKIYIGTKLKNNIKLDSHDLLLWFCNHPDIFLRTPAIRLSNEFIELMKIKLDNLDCGSNILIPKKNLHIIYKSCSSSFTVDLSSIINDIPDISYINSLIPKIQIIANSVMDELENLSRFISRNPDSIDSIKAFSLLPFELQKDYCTDNVKVIKAWILENYNKQNNFTFIDIATKILNLNNVKITSSLHKEICQSLKILGWDMVPYPNEIIGLVKPEMRILLIPYDQNDDKINISPSKNYMLTLIELTLGSYIAHVDKNSLPQQIEYLLERIEKFNHLSTSEKNRLYFYVKWLKIQEIDFTALIRKLKNLDEDSKITCANIAVAVAASKGQILPDEIKALETIYKSMGLDKQALFSSMHSLDKISIYGGIGSDRQKLNSYSVNSIICLDSNQIALTLQDTAKASTLLTNIFGDNDETIQLEENEICEENILFAGLNIKENNLLQELLTKTEWSHYEYKELANKHKMMPDGAIETINEWAFEVYGEAVIENDGNIIINKNLIK